MLQVIHIVQIILGFLAAGATGMENTIPQYNAIWMSIQLLSTTLLTVLGLVSNPIGGNTLSAVQKEFMGIVSKTFDTIDKVYSNSSKLSAFIGILFLGFMFQGCIPNPLSQVQTFQAAYTCIQQNWGQEFSAIEAACLPGQGEVVADIILDIEAVIEWVGPDGDAGTGIAVNKVGASVYVLRYSQNPVVQKRITERGLVLGK